MDEDKVMVIFQPSGRRGEVPKGITLLEASRLLGVDIEALCGEKRVCGKCVVRIEEGYFEKFGIQSSMSHVSPWQGEEDKFITPEKREKGFRLSCSAQIEGDILVFVPEESRAGSQRAAKGHQETGAPDEVQMEGKEATHDGHIEHPTPDPSKSGQDSHDEGHDEERQRPNPPSRGGPRLHHRRGRLRA